MANIEALRQEALDRAIEALELEIEEDVLKIRLKTEQLSRLKDKDAKGELKEEILWAENRIEKNKIKLDALKKLTPYQYVEGRVNEVVVQRKKRVTEDEKFLTETQNHPFQCSIQHRDDQSLSLLQINISCKTNHSQQCCKQNQHQ